jgi:hypothetical protein
MGSAHRLDGMNFDGLVFNPSTVDDYAYLFGCTTVAGV